MSEYLRIECISKYINNNKIIDNVSLFANNGDIIGFLGPNGSGKTTTIKIILGLVNADKGNIYLFGKENNVKQMCKVGFCLDKHGLYEDLTARENLLFYGKLYKLSNVELKENIEYFSKLFKIDKRLDEPIKSYSKGMKQKVSIIRSILHKPKLLILDEPTSGFDPDMQIQFRNTISILSKKFNTTVFFSSHQLDQIEKICNKIAIILNGKIVIFEEIKKLKNNNINDLCVLFIYELNKRTSQNWIDNVKKITIISLKYIFIITLLLQKYMNN